MAVVGVGIDLVSIPDFAEQVDQPGTVFAEILLPGLPTPRVRTGAGTHSWG